MKLKQSGGIEPQKLLKSTDGQNWTKWENPSSNGISLQAGESVYIKADEDATCRTGAYYSATYSLMYNYFEVTNSIECTGDVRSLVKFVAPADYSYWLSNLFSNCIDLVKAPALPATTLAPNCYYSMFYGCRRLEEAPELPATTLAPNCYYSMFSECESLTGVPALPATTLASDCYSSMFYGCTGIFTSPELPATEVAYSCYNEMFYNCSGIHRIKMNASSGSWGSNMFNGCTSLELVDMTGSTGVPTLEDVNNFENTNDTYKVVVPDSLYDEWIAATNWASIASHIMKQSDWNAAHPDDQL